MVNYAVPRLRSARFIGGMAAVHFRPSLRLAGLILAVLVAACGEDEESVPDAESPSPTSAPSPSPLPPTTTVAPAPSSPLGKALAGGEVLAKTPLAKPNLVYAVKEGAHVTVFQRNISTGTETVILEYEESYEAEHSANFWVEQPPGITFSESSNTLLFIQQDAVSVYDVDTGATRNLLRREPGPPLVEGGLARSRWIAESGSELCCAFDIATPVISLDGQRVAVAMAQWEGSSIGVFDTTGGAACLIERATSHNPVWGPNGDLLIPGGSGDFTTPGLFVVPHTDPCGAAKIAESPPQYHAGFTSGAWSGDGTVIVASLGEGDPEPVLASLRLISRDGAENRIVVGEGFNDWPTFDPTGLRIYFIRRSGPLRGAEESIWRYDLDSGRATLMENVPAGWSMRKPSWTADGHLVFRVNANSNGCVYWSCANRIVVLDPESGGVVYASAARDFTNYLGFLP